MDIVERAIKKCTERRKDDPRGAEKCATQIREFVEGLKKLPHCAILHPPRPTI